MSEIVKMPMLGLDMQEGTFLNWVKKEGETVKQGEVLAEVEADKATIEIEATAGGVLLKTLVKPGDTVKVGMDLAQIGETSDSSKPAAEPVAVAVSATPAAVSSATPAPSNGSAAAPVIDPSLPGGVRASPIARKLAEEKGIDLRQVPGSGPGGRIVKSDVESFQPATAPAARPVSAPSVPAPLAPAAHKIPTGPDVVEEPLPRIRQRIAARTTESKQNVPHFYVTIEIDMVPALTLRKQINEGLPEEQKVSVNDLVVKAAALALRKFPNLNSHYYGDRVLRHKRVNIGMAVALETGGLINVVAKDADITSISRLAQRNKEMIAGARSGKVKPDDLDGSTFTVSNLGPYNVEHFEAIINPPEAAILAVSSAQQVPIVVNGEIKIGTRMKCTISVDHRVSDGAEGAQFLNELRALLENPMRLLL